MQVSNALIKAYSKGPSIRLHYADGTKSKWFIKVQNTINEIEDEANEKQVEKIELGTITPHTYKGKKKLYGQSKKVRKSENYITISQTSNQKLNGMENNNNDPLGLKTETKAEQPQARQNNFMPPPDASAINSMMYYEMAQLKERIGDLKTDLKEVQGENKTLEKENRELKLFKETAEVKNNLELEKLKYNESNTLAGALRELTKPETANALGGYVGAFKGQQAQLNGVGESSFVDDNHKYLFKLGQSLQPEDRAFVAMINGMMVSHDKDNKDYKEFFKKITELYSQYSTKVKPLKID